MSKSRNNAVMLGATKDETVTAIRGAKTGAQRTTTYEPDGRPEVASLLSILSLVTVSRGQRAQPPAPLGDDAHHRAAPRAAPTG